MLLVALTGGIGSGKSTVAAGLAERGAAVVDADAVSREILEPDGAAYQAVVDQLRPRIVRPDRSINRPALAGIVFGDPDALATLNQLTHPVIGQVMAERAHALGSDHQIVVLDVALLSIVTTNRFQLGRGSSGGHPRGRGGGSPGPAPGFQRGGRLVPCRRPD